jgi:hypothetical protein
MDAFSTLSPALISNVGLWIGFLFSLMIFSAILGDHLLARLAQYILVGAALGYVAVLAWQQVLRPRLFTPLWTATRAGEPVDLWLWALLTLAVLLFVAGLERIFRTPTARKGSGGWRALMAVLGSVPLAVMLGVAVAAGVIGAAEGTLFPQFMRAARMGLPWRAAPGDLLLGALMLLITGGSLIHLRTDMELIEEQPSILRQVLRWWAGLGKRALWLAAGLVFARLLVARLTLLIARMEFFMIHLEQTGLWRWAEEIWARIGGG